LEIVRALKSVFKIFLRLLAAALTSQVVALLSISIHFLLFAWNGKGVPGLENFGDVVEIFSQVPI
jgi:hypothetical protein